MMKKVFLATGLILVCAAGLWYFGLSSRWTNRITPGWEWASNTIGTVAWADFETGIYPDDSQVTFNKRLIHPVGPAAQSGGLLLEDVYTTIDPSTGEVTWESVYAAPVDPKTGAHLQQEYAGDQFVFPRNVEKKPYNIRYSSYKGLPLTFQGQEAVEGLQTYLFSYKGAAEYTEAYQGTEGYEGVEVEPGQEIRCTDDQFTVKLWVEPVTGEIVKYDEGCPSGDSVFDIASNEELYPLSRWTGASAGDDVVLRASQISRQRAQYFWLGLYIPLILLLAGLLFLGLGALMKRGPHDQPEDQPDQPEDQPDHQPHHQPLPANQPADTGPE